HVKARANNKKMQKRIAHQEALFYEELLKKEINEDREAHGKKIEDSKGTKGFGYDPIVFLPEYNKTVAELTEEEKNKISHRGKAVKEVMAAFKQFNLF
ncbi:MAG: hypothetical protein IIX47_06635, partial [Spirochaetaceae bacterium]|nr:hypothetical protein [Spirochaetaceae bacterium]